MNQFADTEARNGSPVVQKLLLLLFFLLPFERIPSFVVAGFTVKLSYVVGVILLLVLVGEWLLKPSREAIRLPQADLILGGLWIAALLSTLLGGNISRRSLVIVLVWGFVFGMHVVATRIIKRANLQQQVERVILAVTAAVCLFGIYQFLADSWGAPLVASGLRVQYSKAVFGFPRIQSVALEPLYFSNFLLVPFFLSLARMIQGKVWNNRYFWLCLLILVNIILGISRGAYVALVVGLIVFGGYILFSKINNKWKIFASLILLFALGGVISLGAIRSVDGKKATTTFVGHASVDDKKTGSSLPGRFETYRLAYTFFKERPILGNGVASFGLKTVRTPEELKQYGYGIVNNEYLELLCENGLVGLLLFLAFLLYVLKDVLGTLSQRGPDSLRLVALLSGLIAIFVQYNFFSTLYILYIWMFLALLRACTGVKNKSIA
jgi:putative inorganic carbon (HCO3(-)) transporter